MTVSNFENVLQTPSGRVGLISNFEISKKNIEEVDDNGDNNFIG